IGLMYGAIRYNLYKEYKVQEKLRALVDERTAQLKLEKQAVVERNFVIRKQSVELAKMNKAKDNFIYLLGHDMRSPLQSMLGTTSILETDYDRLSESERNELIQLTKSAFGHLNNLITNLLDWAQMDAGLVEPKFENVELNEMIRQIINLNSHALNKK